MLDDLFRRYEVIGMGADSVEELLGPLKWSVSRDSGFEYRYEVADAWGRPGDFVVSLNHECKVVSVLLNWEPWGGVVELLPTGGEDP